MTGGVGSVRGLTVMIANKWRLAKPIKLPEAEIDMVR
jgi:hypothetical protein